MNDMPERKRLTLAAALSPRIEPVGAACARHKQFTGPIHFRNRLAARDQNEAGNLAMCQSSKTLALSKIRDHLVPRVPFIVHVTSTKAHYGESWSTMASIFSRPTNRDLKNLTVHCPRRRRKSSTSSSVAAIHTMASLCCTAQTATFIWPFRFLARQGSVHHV